MRLKGVSIAKFRRVSKSVDIPGGNLYRVSQSSYFLRMVSLYNSGEIGFDTVPLNEGERVAVLGAGNVAMDAARTAMRMGAKEVNDSGYVITKDYPYGMTTRRGVFAGGDVVHTPQTVVLAMREAKLVSKGIAQYVDAVKLLGSM